MSGDDHEAVVQRFFELTNRHEYDALASLLAPGYHLHFNGMPPLDVAGAMEFFGQFFAAFPGIQHEIVDQFAAGDRVATRVVVTGVHTGAFMGIPPSGRTISVGAINIHRFAGDQVIEQWISTDSLEMLQQLGAIPAAASS